MRALLCFCIKVNIVTPLFATHFLQLWLKFEVSVDKVVGMTDHFQRCEVELDYAITKLKNMTIKALLGCVKVGCIIRVKAHPFMQSFAI